MCPLVAVSPCCAAYEQVIYVDADQVVRADIAELWDLDLQGHAYAYTPFCTSRKETLGFQFWQQGYWKDHLRGRPYHISALYVVDLQRFRWGFYCALLFAIRIDFAVLQGRDYFYSSTHAQVVLGPMIPKVLV